MIIRQKYPISIPLARSHIANARHFADAENQRERSRAELFTANLDRAIRVEFEKKVDARLDEDQVEHLTAVLLSAAHVPSEEAFRIASEVRGIAAKNGARPHA